MSENKPVENSLVLYKSRPARVQKVTDKLVIELESGSTQRVRHKDVQLLHRGPLYSLAELKSQSGELEEAWELLTGKTTDLAELSELIFGQYTPSTAWTTWQLIADELYFYGNPDEIKVRRQEEVVRERKMRAARTAKAQQWSEFMAELRAEKVAPKDIPKLSEVEALARGQSSASKILRQLGRQDTSQNAHALLLKVGLWNETVNPYPARLRLITEPPKLELPSLPDEKRVDLTHLLSFAIDDEGNQEPDDAISLDGDRIWVHVADVAALVKPDSDLDLEARGRGAALYLPEQTVTMIPREAIQLLGLGLSDISPALSFKLTLLDSGELTTLEVVPSWVRVTRLTYSEAEKQLSNEPFKKLRELAGVFREQRKANGAADIRLPEVTIRVVEGEVIIRPMPSLESRALVTEIMLMAGQAAARFASEQNLPFPFTTQSLSEILEQPRDPAAMFAYRKRFKRSQMKSVPEPHAGLGLEFYAQVTSPLRRYLDLVAHQQLRACLRGETPLLTDELMLRVGSAEAVIGEVRRAERLSNMHWKLVYLQRHPNWCGPGIVVEKRGSRATVLIPDLGLDATVYVGGEIELNSKIMLSVANIDLPTLTVHFHPNHMS
jgi:exoribonuclease-2